MTLGLAGVSWAQFYPESDYSVGVLAAFDQFKCEGATATVVSPPDGNPHYPYGSYLTNTTSHSIVIHRFQWGALQFVWRMWHVNTCDGRDEYYMFGPYGGGTAPCWTYTSSTYTLNSESYLGRVGGFVVTGYTDWRHTHPDDGWRLVASDTNTFQVDPP